MTDLHSIRSSFRESLLEHALIYELLREAWRRGLVIDVLRPEVDTGVDVIFESGSIVRHVQLKSTQAGSGVRRWNINSVLATKPSAAAILQEFKDEDGGLSIRYRFFGGPPGVALSLDGFKTGKHTKASAEGVKALRPAIRVVPLSQFEPVADTAELFGRLFGVVP